jgi:iron complex outermembrane receptor protein
MQRGMAHRGIACALLLGLLAPLRARADEGPRELAEMSLEELLAVEVYSASRRSERLIDSPAAVYVITAEDIRRSGMTSVPELLRMVPGMNVSQASANAWAISARGGQSQFDRNLLVMIDGRSVYTPIFAGVYWDVQDVPLEDIARIEVIRGPGGTVWGANAVNGVVNILTRHAAETPGAELSLRAGNTERGGLLRQSFRLGENAALRLSAHGRDVGKTRGAGSLAGETLHDGWQSGGLQGRLDWELDGDDSLRFTFNRLSSDREDVFRLYDAAYSNPAGTVEADHDRTVQGHGALRWVRELGEGESLELSGYLDSVSERSPRLDSARYTSDVEFQHNLRAGPRLQASWGLDMRHYHTRLHGTPTVNFDADQSPFLRTTEQQGIYGGFGQAVFALVPDELSLTLGSKLSWNSYSRWEVQPNARLMWTPDARQNVWAAVSRAVRTPSIVDRQIDLVASVLPFVPFAGLGGAGLPPTYPCHEFALGAGGNNCPVFVRGSDSVGSESMLAYEAGYRVRPAPEFNFDLALFYMDYDDVLAPADTPSVSNGQLVLEFDERIEQYSYGAELSATWQVRPWWQLRAAWWGVQLQRRGADGAENEEAVTPHHFGLLASRLDLPLQLELDTSVYFQGRREFIATQFQPAAKIDGHARVDVRLGWRPRSQLEVSLAVLDLFDREDEEFVLLASAQGISQTQRSVLAQLRWSF